MKVIDPVCGMGIEPAQADAAESYLGQTFYFCTDHCHLKFKADPAWYVGSTSASGADARRNWLGQGTGQRH